MQKLIIASNNKDKIAEISAMLKGRFEVLSMKDTGLDLDIEETGTTFKDNALIKAKACFEASGLASLADDSGLCVDALGGEPGVYSAEYAVRHFKALGDNHLEKVGHYSDDMSNANVDLVLDKMKGKQNKKAKFVCAMAYFDGEKQVFGYGETAGEILQQRQGVAGFGYDPIFFSHELNTSFGLALPEDKNSVSHRRRALENFIESLIGRTAN